MRGDRAGHHRKLNRIWTGFELNCSAIQLTEIVHVAAVSIGPYDSFIASSFGYYRIIRMNYKRIWMTAFLGTSVVDQSLTLLAYQTTDKSPLNVSQDG